jgi:hypothetical protein
VCTDHLNNVMVETTTELRQPGKILRWLLEIMGMGKLRWAFTPGVANVFADWASRNPRDRDQLIDVEGEDVDTSGLPKTLMEAYHIAAASQGVLLKILPTFDKTGQPTTEDGSRVKASRQYWESFRMERNWTAHEVRVQPQYELRRTFARNVLADAESTELRPMRVLETVYVPGARATDLLGDFPEVTGEHARLNVKYVVDPPLDCSDGGLRKWVHLGERTSAELHKKTRNAVTDGIMHLFRDILVRGVQPEALLVQGEATFSVLAAMRRRIREEVYKKRRVDKKEIAECEKLWKGIHTIVFIAPGGYPPRNLLDQIDNAMPEFRKQIFVPSGLQVKVVIPKDDAMIQDSKELALRLRKAVGPENVCSRVLPAPAYLKGDFVIQIDLADHLNDHATGIEEELEWELEEETLREKGPELKVGGPLVEKLLVRHVLIHTNITGSILERRGANIGRAMKPQGIVVNKS